MAEMNPGFQQFLHCNVSHFHFSFVGFSTASFASAPRTFFKAPQGTLTKRA
jgi:hypothetical protein